MRVQACIASLKGHLSPEASSALHALSTGSASPLYGGHRLHCWRVSLLATPLHEMLLIGPDQPDQVNPMILYLPGDDEPIREFDSLRLAGHYLREKLLDSRFADLVLASAPQRLQPGLALDLKRALYENPYERAGQPLHAKAKPHIESTRTLLPEHPWATLHALHVQRIKADARSIAVPTADVDAAARLASLEHWLEGGLTVLNIAAMFVPALNPIMLTLGAAQIMGNVFHGIEAWEQGDNAQALAQLESVLLNVAVAGTVGGGVKVFEASGFVDAMHRIVVGGRELLWSPDLSGYASTIELPATLEADEAGRFTIAGQHYVRLDDQLYLQVEDAEQRWRISHPDDPQAYRPRLLDKPEGGWRLEHEQPLDWQDAQLVRRLGPITSGLDDADLTAALRITATDASVLRHNHIAAEPPPSLLADALDRLRCDRQTDDLIDRVRYAKPLAAHKNFAISVLHELPGWPQDHVIKAFKGPEPWGEFTRYGGTGAPFEVEIPVTRSDLETGKLSQVVLAHLQEDARDALLPAATPSDRASQALDGLLAEHLLSDRRAVFESLYSSTPRPLDEAAQTLARQFPGLPQRAVKQVARYATAAERERLHAGRVPLRIAEEARLLQARARLDRALLGLYRPTLANADSARISRALLANQTPRAPEQLFETAASDRDHAATLIGQQPLKPGFISPLRLSDGRLGYPLSGRPRLPEWLRLGRPNAQERRLQELYPALGQTERHELLTRLRQRGDVGAQLAALRQQQQTLAGHLQSWVLQAPAEMRLSYEVFEEVLNRAWRQDDGNTLALEAMSFETLPSLPARFDHITTIRMRNINVSQMPPDFLQSFPSLRTFNLTLSPEVGMDSVFLSLRSAPHLRGLELGANGYGTLTPLVRETLSGLSHLQTLSLRRNLIQLGEADMQVLAGLPLESLDLGYNRITLDATTADGFTRLYRLRDLRLTGNPLHRAPNLSGLNNLTNLQARDCDMQAWPQGLTVLMSNPNYQLRYLSLPNNGIAQIPELDQLLTTPYIRDLSTGNMRRYFEFSDNAIDAPTQQRLRDVGVEILDPEDFLGEDETVSWLVGATPEQRQLWDDLFADDALPHLREVIERVGQSAQALANQQSLAGQIWRLLTSASQEQALRERLELVASDFPASCGDAGADAFSALEIEVLAHEQSADAQVPGPHLFNFYRRLFRRAQVNRLAERIHAARISRQAALAHRELLPAEQQTPVEQLPALDELDDISDQQLRLGGLDDIETRLALRQALAEGLDFTEPSQDMLYRDAAQVSMTTEFNVEQAVLALDSQRGARRAWIASQPSWQRFLEGRYAERFNMLDMRWHAGLEYLEYCLDENAEPVSMLDAAVIEALTPALPQAPLDNAGQLRRMDLTDQQYRDSTECVSAGRQAQREALLLQLTATQDPNN